MVKADDLLQKVAWGKRNRISLLVIDIMDEKGEARGTRAELSKPI